MDITDKQSIYNSIQSANGDSKKVWAIAQNIHALYKEATNIKKQHTDTIKQNEEGFDFISLLDDKQKLRACVLEDLFKGSQSGNSQASDKLAKLAGLDAQAIDLVTEIIDYSNVIVDCPECGANIHKLSPLDP